MGESLWLRLLVGWRLIGCCQQLTGLAGSDARVKLRQPRQKYLFMSDSPQQTLTKLTELISDQHNAKRVLYVSPHDIAHPGWDWVMSNRLMTERFEAHYDLAALDLSEGPLNQAAVQLVTRLRDLLAKRVVISARAEDTLYGLGFYEMDLEQEEADPKKLRYWQYNIHDYKQVPDWLNARFWANPQNFNKYRW